MEEPFVLEVTYKEVKHEFPAQLQLLGFTHRFVISLPIMDVWFERDEEGGYRAVVPPETDEKAVQKLDKALLETVARQIEAILK